MSTDETDKDEPKTERFNMFMSPSEMKAIDDWAWENRVRSKSEAVRRLVQIGLVADKEVPPLLEILLSKLSNPLFAKPVLGDLLRGKGFNAEDVERVTDALADQIFEAAKKDVALIAIVGRVVSQIMPFADSDDLLSAIRQSLDEGSNYIDRFASLLEEAANQMKQK